MIKEEGELRVSVLETQGGASSKNGEYWSFAFLGEIERKDKYDDQ